MQIHPGYSKETEGDLLLGGVGETSVVLGVPRDSVVGKAAQTVLGRAANVDVGGGETGLAAGADVAVGRGRLTQAVVAGAVGNVGGDAASANVDSAGIGRVPVRGDGRLVGKRQVGLALLDGLGVGVVNTGGRP